MHFTQSVYTPLPGPQRTGLMHIMMR